MSESEQSEQPTPPVLVTQPTQPTEPTVAPELAPTPEPELVPAPVQPIHVDGRNRRTDDDALPFHFVDVVDGEHKGRFGAFVSVLEHDADGWPKQALVRTRDEFNQLLSVAYEHLRPSASHGGR